MTFLLACLFGMPQGWRLSPSTAGLQRLLLSERHGGRHIPAGIKVSDDFRKARLPAVDMAAVENVNQGGEISVKRAYLITDRGFVKRFAGSLLLLSAVAHLPHMRSITSGFQVLAKRLEWWSALGLLSSSCCALQLFLNLFSVGCAGFNTVLGPVRPYALALTVMLQASAWRSDLASRSRSLLIISTILCTALSLLPEVLHLWVKSGGRRLMQPPASSNSLASSKVEPLGSTSGSSEAYEGKELVLNIKGMGCTACTAKVKGALEAVPGVASCAVTLESSSALLELEAGWSDVGITKHVVEALEQAGFSGAVSDA